MPSFHNAPSLQMAQVRKLHHGPSNRFIPLPFWLLRFPSDAGCAFRPLSSHTIPEIVLLAQQVYLCHCLFPSAIRA